MGTTGVRAARSELLMEVAQMQHEEVEFFSQRLANFGPKEGEKIHQAFRSRAGELLACATVQQLDHARRTLMVLRRTDNDFSAWHASAIGLVTPEKETTRWPCPTRAFEERIAHLAYKAVHNLPALAQCHAVTSDLAPRGILRAKVHDAVVTCILRWVEREQLGQLIKQAALLCELAKQEPQVMVVLERRLVRRARQSFSAGRLAGFVQCVLNLQDRGLEVLDGPGAPMVDMTSATRFAPLQVALLDALRVAFKDWPISRVAEEIQGCVLDFAVVRPDLKENVSVAATDRIHAELHTVRDLILRRVDPKRVQQEFLYWGTVAKAMGDRGLLNFSEPIRLHVLGGPDEIGSMSFCAASVTPTAPEMPPEYLPHVSGLYERVNDIWKAVMEVVVMIGEEVDVVSARKLLAERIA